MPINYQKLSVLIADDFSSFRSTVNSMLLNLGVQNVVMVANGEEVLQKCAKWKFDIILCDYDLGNGRNGQHVLEELRFREMIDWRTLFIMVSAESSRNIVMSAYDCEPDDYLMKPITPRMLQTRIERQIRLRTVMAPVNQAIMQGDEEKAIDLLIDMSLEQNRYSTAAQKRLGELFLKVGEYKKAEKLYTKALEIRQLEWARLGLARVKQETGELDTAKKWLNRIVDDNPLFLPAYDVLADNWDQRGEPVKCQETVQQAVDVSPMSILRQKRLANVAEGNGDNATVLEALRRCIRLGKYSCHGSVEDSKQFAQLASKMDFDDLEKDAIYAEAKEVLAQAKKQFQLSDQELTEISQIEDYVDAAQSGRSLAENIELEMEAASDVNSDTPLQEDMSEDDIALQITGAYAAITEGDLLAVSEPDSEFEKEILEVTGLLERDELERASALLLVLKDKYRDDEQALQRLDEYLDEPASQHNIEVVATANREGIDHYSEGSYDLALECFERARCLFPKHIGIQLNIAQCLIGKLKHDGSNEYLYHACDESLNIVGELINETDDQYDRFCKLRKLADNAYKPSNLANTNNN